MEHTFICSQSGISLRDSKYEVCLLSLSVAYQCPDRAWRIKMDGWLVCQSDCVSQILGSEISWRLTSVAVLSFHDRAHWQQLEFWALNATLSCYGLQRQICILSQREGPSSSLQGWPTSCSIFFSWKYNGDFSRLSPFEFFSLGNLAPLFISRELK